MSGSPVEVLPPASSSGTDFPGRPARRRKRRAVFFLFLLVLLVGLLWAFLRAGVWLVVQDPLVPAQTIVVLSGRMPVRALEAARLYRESAAPQVWVSQPIGPAALLAEMQIPFVGEDFYNQRILIAMGVPVAATRILPEPSANTAEEIAQIGRLARAENLSAVVIVTSAPHTRRVHAIWDRLVGDSPRLIVRHPLDDPFDAAHWWRNTQDALDVVREWLGLVNAWAGFPSQPNPH
jgi:uncharacterized SAM-binding protein YcdF (DUF218 family)